MFGELSMDDSPIFQGIRQMLGSAPPWFIHGYCYLASDASILEVSLAHETDAQFRCAMCDRTLPCQGDGPEWVYRCVTCVGPRVYVRFRMPQVSCPIHGTVHADVQWMRDPERWLFDRIVYADEDPCYGTIH
jgi:hypothetical protein